MIGKLRKGIQNPARLFDYIIKKLLVKPRVTVLNQSPSINIASSTTVALQATVSTGNGEINIDENCDIHSQCKLLPYGGHISIGSNSSVNPFTILYGHGGLDIGEGVRIAAHNTIIPANHVYSDPEELIYKQGLTTEGITVEDDVWIGAGCCILDGVTIGEGAVIAAGSVVTDPIPPYTVAAGTPAEPIKSRD